MSFKYEDYKEYIKNKGWIFEGTQIIDQYNIMITTHTIIKGNTGMIVSLRCPIDKKISMIGKIHDKDKAYGIGLSIYDINNIEIPFDSKIMITKEYHDIITYFKGKYWQIKMFEEDEIPLKLKFGVELNYNDKLVFWIINSPLNIESNNTKFKIKIDTWKNV